MERYALLCGYSVERRVHDYGIDLVILTYDPQGNVENGEILVQLKATDHPRWISQGGTLPAASSGRTCGRGCTNPGR